MAYDPRYPNGSPTNPVAPAPKPTDQKTLNSAVQGISQGIKGAFGSIGNTAPAKPSIPPIPFQGFVPMPTAPTNPTIGNGRNRQGYKETTAPFGMDMTMPGVYEQIQQNMQDAWLGSPNTDWVHTHVMPQLEGPLAGEQAIGSTLGDNGSNFTGEYWEGVQGAGNTPAENKVQAGYKDPNLASVAFGQIQDALPGSLQPQFDKYYDRMHDKAISDVNSQSAARGSYGSNSALNNSIGAGLDVEAQRAKAATDFSLADSANQRDWMSLLGGQGSAADASGVNAYNANVAGAKYGLDKTKTLGDLAFNADTVDLNRDKFDVDRARTLDDMTLNRLGAGTSAAFGQEGYRQQGLSGAFRAAEGSQQAREQRINTLYNQVSGLGSDVQNFFMDNYSQLLGGDAKMSDSELQTMIAKEADQRGWDQHTQERIFRDFKTAWDMFKGNKSEKESTGETK